MLDSNKHRNIFFAAPLMLIGIVFTVTFIFSRFLETIFLSIPLLCAYYGTIWGFIAIYQRKFGQSNPVLKYSELKPGFTGLAIWMVLYTTVYPLLTGFFSFFRYSADLPLTWILLGIPFCLVNGPSEEIFWRLFMERLGVDGKISANGRLIYSSVIFGLWHFIFVIFLIPKERMVMVLLATIAITTIAGFFWMIIYQKSRNMFPNIFSHTILNFLQIWPWLTSTILGLNPHLF